MRIKVFILSILLTGLFFGGVVLASDCPDNASFDELSQSCQCKSGYAMVKSECVTQNQYCADSFGANSSYDAVNNKCKCNYGYIAVQSQCVNANSYCHDVLGSNSDYSVSLKDCVCQKGYVLFENSCMDGDKYCKSKSGSRSSYDIISKSCVCDSGYELKNDKCVTVEILSVLPSKGAIGDLIKIQGNNLGSEEKNYLYIDDVLVNLAAIISWSDGQIVFKVADYMSSGNIILKTGEGLIFSGPYFEISGDALTDDSSAKVTLNQQINITGAGDSVEQEAGSTSTNSTSKTTTSTIIEKTQPGFFSFLSDFASGLLNGVKHVFSALFG